MNDEKYDAFGSEGPEVEPSLLIRFLLKKFDELLEREHPKMSVLYMALALAAVSGDETADSELQAILCPESQVQRCHDILAQTLARIEDGQLSEYPEAKAGSDMPLPEWAHRQALLRALIESNKMLDEDNFEFAQMIGVLGWIALQCYPRRLNEFQAALQSLEEDPVEAIQRGLEVLRIAFMSKDKDVAAPRQKELRSRRIAQDQRQ